MAAALPITLRAFAALAVEGVGTGSAVDCTLLAADTDPTSTIRVPRWAAKVHVDVLELSAGATLKIDIQTSDDPDADWRTIYEGDDITAPLEERRTLHLGKLQRYARARWTLTGTDPTARFGVTGEAHTVYCKPSDITDDAISEYALDRVAYDKRVRACIVASTEAEGYLSSAFKTPILAWDDAVTEKTSLMAAPKLLSARGRHPESPDESVFKAAEEAVRWFTRISRGLKPPGIIDTTPTVFEAAKAVAVATRPGRGWGT
jgi:hypothetical protein